MFDFVKSMYPQYWDKKAVAMAVQTNWITPEEYQTITDEAYVE